MKYSKPRRKPTYEDYKKWKDMADNSWNLVMQEVNQGICNRDKIVTAMDTCNWADLQILNSPYRDHIFPFTQKHK